MRIFKDNPILLIWLIILTALAVFSLFSVKVTVNLQVPDKASATVKTSQTNPTIEKGNS